MRLASTLLLCTLLFACGNEPDGRGAPLTNSDASTSTSPDANLSARDAAMANAPDSGSPGPRADAGANATPSGRYFPEGAFMYQRVDGSPLDPQSSTVTRWLQDHGGFGTGAMRIDFSIEVLSAPAGTPLRAFMPTSEFYTPDCDPAPIPVPAVGALEGESGYTCSSDGDCHLIVVDRARQRLYEMWRANISGSTFRGGCAAIWDMTRVYGPEGRGEQCSSADAAGFPIAPLLFSADEVLAGAIEHAIRFILPNERMRSDSYQHPANHAGGPSGPADAPIYGSRWRLRQDYDLARLPSHGARVVALALQRYGMVLADGGNIALTAQSDRFTSAKWAGLLDTRALAQLQPSDFEIVQTGEPIELTFECQRTPIRE
jgi:hypothetical protein